MSNWLGNLLSRVSRSLVAQSRPDVNQLRRSRSTRRYTTRTSNNMGQHPSGSRYTGGSGRREYPGNFKGTPRITYSPAPEEEADPDEVVWTQVSYKEDHRGGKDQSVLIIGCDHERLLGLLLTSKDHDRGAAQEVQYGRPWMSIGTGEWNPRQRPSEVRINRVLRIDPDGIRRIGAVLDHEVFEIAVVAVRA